MDAEKVDSIVKAVITSSDDEHESHFLLPGFFKTITSKQTTEKKEQETTNDQTQPSNTPASPPPEQPKVNENQTSTQSEQQTSLSSSAINQKPSDTTSQSEANKSSTTAPSTNQQQQQQQNVPRAVPPVAPQGVLQQEDEGIRRLLRYYHIDDGDIVEVAGGSPPRLVLVHPERPLPPYIQHNKQLLEKLQAGLSLQCSLEKKTCRFYSFLGGINLPSASQNGLSTDQSSTTDLKPKITLDERVSRGEAQKGPTVPPRQEQKQDNSLPSIGVRQVYPQLSAAQQEEQRRQAKLQATQPAKPSTDDKSTVNQTSLLSKQDENKQTKDISREEEEKIIASVLKQLEPIVEKRVAAELRRLQSDDTDQDEDDNFMPFPFMLGGGLPFFVAPRGGPQPPPSASSSQGPQEQQTPRQQQQQQGDATRVDFGGLPLGADLFPPQILMAMMNDLAQNGMGGELPPHMARPAQGPMGVEGQFNDNNCAR